MIRKKMTALLRKAAEIARRDSGSALVEMYVSSVALLTVFLGVMQLTMACYTYNAIDEVARETARWAVVRGASCHTNTPSLDHCSTNSGASATDIQNHAQSIAAVNWSQCTTSNPCVSVSWMTATTTTGVQQPTTTWAACNTSKSTCNVSGNLVVVNISYPYTLNIPFLNKYSMNLKSTSQMVIAQ